MIWSDHYGDVVRTGVRNIDVYGKVQGTPAQMAYFTAFKHKYKQLSDVQEQWIGQVLNSDDKCLTIINGLRFYFPNAHITRSGWIEDNTKIRNYPVQSFATADIVPIGVVCAWHITKRGGFPAKFNNTVHDSGIGTVKKFFAKEYEAILRYAMVGCVYNYLLNVYNIDYPIPLEIEYSYGPFWSEWVKE